MRTNRPFYHNVNQQYVFTVSNPSHELISPKQYTQIISTISQYQLIPGFLSDHHEDPWEIVLALLPYTKFTILDVTLPYIKKQKINYCAQQKILARYILFKQKVVGIKICTSNKDQNNLEKKSWPKYQFQTVKLPQKIQQFYIKYGVQNYCLQIPLGDFFLMTDKFKMAFLFQSQIKDVKDIQPYIAMGCQIFSIVNNEEYPYQQFLNLCLNYQKSIKQYPSIIKNIIDEYRNQLITIIYGGCKTCPSLGKIYYSKSFIEDYQFSVQSTDVEFMPIVDIEQQKGFQFKSSPEVNFNHINVTHIVGFNRNRQNRMLLGPRREINVITEYPQPIQLDSKIYEISPLKQKDKQKYLYRLNQIKQLIKYHKQQKYGNFNASKKLFDSTYISGKSLIRSMYVFNMINILIFSKQKNERTPFLIGLPMTLKTKNLFDTFVYIYDHFKELEAQYGDLYETKYFRFQDLVQLYRYKSTSKQQSLSQVEKSIMKSITGQQIQIPQLNNLIENIQKQKNIYLCSDDLQEKKKFKNVCKQNEVQVAFVDVLTVDQFKQPLQIRQKHGQIDDLLDLGQQKYTPNIIKMFQIKLRPPLTFQEQLAINNSKKKQFPPQFVKICKIMQFKHFTTIKEVVYFLINQKQFYYNQQNQQLYKQLIINQIGKKYKNSIKTLSSISTFFNTHNNDQIMNRVKQIASQLSSSSNSRKIQNPNIISLTSLESMKSVEIILDSDQQRQIQKLQNREVSEKLGINGNKKMVPQKQKTQQQLYNQRIQKCRRIKQDKQKHIIQKCHRCQTQMNKNLMEKCKKCIQTFCYACLQQITGLSGLKAAKQLNKFCTVCNKYCQCQKCNKKNNLKNQDSLLRLTKKQYGMNLPPQLKKEFFGDSLQTQEKNSNLIKKDSNSIANELLFKTFQEESKKTDAIKYCDKCQIIDQQQKRCIYVQCLECGIQQCYYCIKRKYKQFQYKTNGLKFFYKQFKCFKCDFKWKKFIENRNIQIEKKKQEEEKRKMLALSMINESQQLVRMDQQVISNKTSHYANDQLLDMGGFDKNIPTVQIKHRNYLEKQNNYQFPKNQSDMEKNIKMLEKWRQEQSQNNSHFNGGMLLFPPPQTKMQVQISKKHQSKDRVPILSELGKGFSSKINKRKGSSDSGYDSKQQRNKKSKNVKQQSRYKRKNSSASSQSNHKKDVKKRKLSNASVISFCKQNQKIHHDQSFDRNKIVIKQKKQSNLNRQGQRQRSRDNRNKIQDKPNVQLRVKYQKEQNPKSRKGSSHQSGSVSSSSSSSSSKSSSSSNSSSKSSNSSISKRNSSNSEKDKKSSKAIWNRQKFSSKSRSSSRSKSNKGWNKNQNRYQKVQKRESVNKSSRSRQQSTSNRRSASHHRLQPRDKGESTYINRRDSNASNYSNNYQQKNNYQQRNNYQQQNSHQYQKKQGWNFQKRNSYNNRTNAQNSSQGQYRNQNYNKNRYNRQREQKREQRTFQIQKQIEASGLLFGPNKKIQYDDDVDY